MLPCQPAISSTLLTGFDVCGKVGFENFADFIFIFFIWSVLLNTFKPSSDFSLTSQAVLLLWSLFGICGSYLSLLCGLVFSLQSCDHHLLGDHMSVPYGVPGQVWYLIVSISDFCLPLYLKHFTRPIVHYF